MQDFTTFFFFFLSLLSLYILTVGLGSYGAHFASLLFHVGFLYTFFGVFYLDATETKSS